MNYRHIYHAGNFADIFKHLVLRMVLGYMQQKDKGLLVLDAFAGTGLYNLKSAEAGKTDEFRAGIGRLMHQEAQNPDLKDFQDFVATDWTKRQYAGSPLIAACMLRPQDRLIVNELHPEDNLTLQKNMAGFGRTTVTNIDAYKSVVANIPPVEKRGLFLVDPPFEKPEEFELLLKQMQEWKKRFSTGCYIIWYPIKAGPQVDALHDAAREMGINRTWVTEYVLQQRSLPGGLNGCGLLIFNTPFGIPERIAALGDELAKIMGEGWVESRYLTDE